MNLRRAGDCIHWHATRPIEARSRASGRGNIGRSLAPAVGDLVSPQATLGERVR